MSFAKLVAIADTSLKHDLKPLEIPLAKRTKKKQIATPWQAGVLCWSKMSSGEPFAIYRTPLAALKNSSLYRIPYAHIV